MPGCHEDKKIFTGTQPRRGKPKTREMATRRLVALTLALVRAAHGSEKRDVIMIMADDMRPELNAAYGCAHMKTPGLDALAQDPDTLTFNSAYVAVAWCSPSRTALFTSRRPDTSMTWSVVPSEYWRERGGNFTTLQQYFKEKGGYRVLGFGKIFHPGSASGNNDEQYSWSAETLPYDGVGKECPSGGDLGNGKGASHPLIGHGRAAMAPDETPADDNLAICANATLRRIAEDRSSGRDARPFFLNVGFHRPHIPWNVPQKFYDMYPIDSIELAPNRFLPESVPLVAMENILSGYWSSTFEEFATLRGNGSITADNPSDNTTLPDYWAKRTRQAYWAAVSYADDNIARVLAAAKEAGLYDNSIVLYLSDHGYALGDNAEWSKVTNFEHSAKIPFLLRVPGSGGNGKAGIPQTTNTTIEAVDLMPTLAELAMGAPPPRCPSARDQSRKTLLCTDGKSVAGLFSSDSTAPAPAPAAAFTQVPRGAMRQGMSGSVPAESYMGYTVRVAGWRYTEWRPFNNNTARANWTKEALVGTELYKHDPLVEKGSCTWDYEKRNVESDTAHASIKATLAAMLQDTFNGE